MAGTIKYSSTYRLSGYTDSQTLQAAFNSLVRGDILYIDEDLALDTTVTLDTKHSVKIIGLGEITPSSNGVNCLKLTHTSGNWSTDITFEKLRINNPAATGTGNGIGFEVSSTVSTGGLWHVRLVDCTIQNFGFGFKTVDGFDLVLDNCQIGGCTVAVRSEFHSKGVGQIKIFGGFMTGNTYGISIDNASSDKTIAQGQISVFGCTFGHKREGGHNQFAIFVAKPITGLYLFGNSFEDVAHAVYFSEFEYEGPIPMVITAVGNSLFNIADGTGGAAAWFDTSAQTIPGIGAAVVMGNTSSDSSSLPPLVNIPKTITGHGGVIVAGNANNPYPPYSTYEPSNTYPKQVSDSFAPLPAFTTTDRPNANQFPPGFSIFNITTDKLNISNGTTWKLADGSNA
jgi:hypothetical protein